MRKRKLILTGLSAPLLASLPIFMVAAKNEQLPIDWQKNAYVDDVREFVFNSKDVLFQMDSRELVNSNYNGVFFKEYLNLIRETGKTISRPSDYQEIPDSQTYFYKGYKLHTNINYRKMRKIYDNLINSNISTNEKNILRSQWNGLFNDVVNKDDALVEIELINDSLIWVDEEYYNEEENYYTGQIYSTYHHSTDAISGDEKIYSFKVRVKSKFVNRNVEKHYNKLWNEALSVVNDEIVLDTDTGGNLMTNPLKGTNQKSNKYNLNKYFEELNNKLKDKNNSLVLSYKISSEDSTKNSIDVYVKDIATHSKYTGSKLLKSKIKIKYHATKWLENAKMDERLKINLGKYINFEEYDTKLVDDVLVRAENDKAIGNYGNTYYAGRWVAHTPLSVSFNTTLSENEVLIINGKKVDVLDQTFFKNLKDNRLNASDNSRVLDFDADPHSEINEKNSHKLNEYKIQIIQYEPNSGNNEENIKLIYSKIIEINSRSSKMDFKWYAWDPENNPHQKLLIEKYVKEANGEYKKDSAGNLIDNPMYDASIDPKTGTKKQLVWFDLKPFEEEPIFIDNKYETFADWSKHPKWNEEIDEEYYADTKLPYKSRTLFRPGWDEDKPSGFIAEAVVLGKGGLKEVIGETENFTLFKLEKAKSHNNKYLLKYSNTNTINSIDQIKETGESSYFSTSGIWLFVSNAPNSISNFKLILIQEPGEKNSDSKNPPNSYFTDNVVLDSGQIQPLWKTTTGASFYNYLISVGLTDKEIYKLNYEDAMEYYKGYIERLYYRDYFNSYISIAPTLKTIADDKFSVDEFANRYKNTKLAEVELLSDFTNKDKVNISKVEINPDKSGAFIYFNLNTVEEIYMLNQNPIFMKIKFKDIKPTNNQIINLELNRQYFIDTAKHNYIKDFMTQIWQNKKSWFNGLTDEEFNKLNFTTDFSYLTKLLTIKVELVKPDSNIAIMPYEIFSIPLNVFKISEIDNFDEDKKKNPNHNSANDEDEPNKSQTKANIFANITLKTIELNGLNDVNEIKNFIISEIKKQIQGLELDKDYQIKNLDSVVFEMSLPQIRPSDNKYIHNAILVIEAINGRGILYGKVNNVVFHVFEHEINLKEIEIPDFSFEAGNLSEIREKITRYTYEKLLQRGLILGQDVEISNLENAVRNLAKGKGFKQAVVIKGINRKVVNLTSYNAINNAKIVVDDNGKQFLFDLMSIKTKKFSYKENVLSKLRDKVITDINEYLQKTYDIKYGIDWDLDLNELNNSLRLLTNEKNILKSIQIKIRPIAGSSKNAAEFTIENILNSSVIDDLDDVVVELPNNNDDIQKQKAKNKKLLISILAPLGLITLGISIALGWFIKVRYFDKKIK